ncbi:MAG TPA: hypothetical protein VIE36_01645 [Methylomirabilota bacterium]|jgi:hypothetical protein
MKTLAILTASVALSVLVSGCATQSARPQPAGTAYTGEVWTWDEQESTVTLRRGAETIRVKVTPDQIRGLELHRTATVRGELAPPMEIPRVITPAMPVRAVPRGPVDEQTVNGVVTASDPRGRLSIESDRGPLHVWAAAGADQRFQPGAKVRVEMAVQPVDMIPAGAGATVDPAASPSPPSEPGDHAVVTGRIMGVSKNGTLVVESPTGPVQVWVADSSKYRVEQPVQIRTSVSKLP